MIARIIRIAAYLVVLICVVHVTAEVFRPKDASKRRIDGFEKEDRGNIDVVCVGSSHAFCTWNPIHLYKHYGIRSCVYGSESQPIEASLAFIKRVLDRHHPRLIFLESFMFSVAKTDAKTKVAVAHRAVDAYPWGLDRIFLIEALNSMSGKDDLYFDLRQYHLRWKNLGADDFSIFCDRDCCHGCQLLGRVMPIKKYQHDLDKNWDRGINAYLALRIDQIDRLVRRQGAKLVVFTAPFNASVENARFSKGLSRFLRLRGIDYLNFIDAQCGLQLDVSKDFADNKDGHLNIYGMEKVMDYIGAVLRDQYHVEPDGLFKEEWNADIERYEILRHQELAKWSQPAQKR